MTEGEIDLPAFVRACQFHDASSANRRDSLRANSLLSSEKLGARPWLRYAADSDSLMFAVSNTSIIVITTDRRWNV